MVWPLVIGGLLSAYGSYSQSKSADKATKQNAADNAAALQAQQSQIWGPQQGFLGETYSTGRDIFNANQPYQGNVGAYMRDTMGAGQGAFNNLAMGPQNPYLQGMASNAMSQVSDQFNQQVMPSLLGGANAAGGLGGERFGIQQAQAAKAAAQGMAGAAADVYGRAWDSGMQGQLGALSAMPGMANMGMASLDVPWANMRAYRDTIGSPIVGNGADFGRGSSIAYPGAPGAPGAPGYPGGQPGGYPNETGMGWGGGQYGGEVPGTGGFWGGPGGGALSPGDPGFGTPESGYTGGAGGWGGVLGGLGFGSWW